MSIAQLRTEFSRGELLEDHAGNDPIALFGHWFDESVAAGLRDPNAMTLATVDGAGQPTARIVLLKGYDADGFVFFTNYASRKGRELAANPRACALFFWPELERQVRVDGAAHKVAESESDEYFAQRPLDARLGAWASPQSDPIAGREELEHRLAEARSLFPGPEAPPRPPHWGGYRIIPDAIEFWQGRPSRLHDRLQFVRQAAVWSRVRLAP